MKIAMVANISERIPPKKYGGTERVIYALTEELVHRGHDVTLFATGDSLTSAKLVSVFPRSLRESGIADPYGLSPQRLLNIGIAYQRQDEFDIIHDHNWLISIPTANLSKTPVVMTIHGAFDVNNRQLFEAHKQINYVTISKSQSIPVPSLNYAGIVYNGYNMESYPFSEENDGYLLWVGRICMDKGTHFAIDVAQYLNLPLIMAAKLDPCDQSYFNEYVKPRLSEQIRWIGEVGDEERNHLMSRAMCFLHPVTWREPFGMTLIEAMACGCPVIAFKRGSSSEIIKNGKTGFVVEDVDEMIVMVSQIGKIQRSYCRQYALENFNARRMAQGYETIYQKVIEEKNLERSKPDGKLEDKSLLASLPLHLERDI